MQLVEEERTYAEIVKDKSDERANMEVEGRRALAPLTHFRCVFPLNASSLERPARGKAIK
jgi:hypothetical protein